MEDLFRLKSKGDNAETYFIGFYVTKELYSFLSLYCLYKKQARSTVLREMLETLRKNTFNTDIMINSIADEAAQEYISGKYNTQKHFYSSLRDILGRRGLSEDQINKIVEVVNHKINDTEKERK